MRAGGVPTAIKVTRRVEKDRKFSSIACTFHSSRVGTLYGVFFSLPFFPSAPSFFLLASSAPFSLIRSSRLEEKNFRATRADHHKAKQGQRQRRIGPHVECDWSRRMRNLIFSWRRAGVESVGSRRFFVSLSGRPDRAWLLEAHAGDRCWFGARLRCVGEKAEIASKCGTHLATRAGALH